MRKMFFFCGFFCFLFSCEESLKRSGPPEPLKSEIINYSLVGGEFTADNSLNAKRMTTEFQNLKTGDTISVKFSSRVKEVCTAKGCWMKLQLRDNEEVMVKFRDYAFFVPKDIEGKEVIVKGKAFISTVSVEEQRHFAEDAGKTSEEIAAITETVKTFSFLADGVLIKN